jgi:hypothetical protein
MPTTMPLTVEACDLSFSILSKKKKKEKNEEKEAVFCFSLLPVSPIFV